MTINLQKPDITELKPRITVFGVGGGGGNAVNNMIRAGMDGVEFVVANTDAQALSSTAAERVIQMGHNETQGLGAGSDPAVGRAAAEECISEVKDHLAGTHMCFVTAGMGGGTGTGAAAVVAKAARDQGILTIGVVTKPFDFEGKRRMDKANEGISELAQNVDTLIVIPNQNLFRIANDKTGFADAFAMADQVLYSGVACITDLMVKEGLINLDFADVRSVMAGMGNAMMGTGEASGEDRARLAAEDAISNPLLDNSSMKGAKGLLISITGGRDITLFEVDEAATRIRQEVDEDANIIVGATFDESLDGTVRVSVVATGVERAGAVKPAPIGVASAPVFGAPTGQITGQPATQPATEPAGIPSALGQQAHAEKVAKAAAEVARLERELQVPKPSNIDPAVKITPSKPVPQLPSLDAELEEGFKQALAGELTTPSQPTAQKPVTAPSPAPGSAPGSAARMPRPDEFPAPGQTQLQEQASPNATPVDERTALGLFKRLTTGLAAKEAQSAGNAAGSPATYAAPSVGAATPQTSSAQVAPQIGGVQAYTPHARRQDVADENLFSPAQQPLDEHGRVAQPAKLEDDQLDIPAFLRRQA